MPDIETLFDTQFMFSLQFLRFSAEKKHSIVANLQATHIDGFLDVVKKLASHPIGKAVFSNKVRKVHWYVIFFILSCKYSDG